MTGPEIIRMILCNAGYDRNLTVHPYKGDGGIQGYEVHAETSDGECFDTFGCESLSYVVYSIIKKFKDATPAHIDYAWWDMPASAFKSDASVKEIRDSWDALELERCNMLEKLKPLHDWIAKNNPCSEDCDMNEHDNEWDDIHYHCQKCHTSSCPRLTQFHKDYQTFKAEFEKHNK